MTQEIYVGHALETEHKRVRACTFAVSASEGRARPLSRTNVACVPNPLKMAAQSIFVVSRVFSFSPQNAISTPIHPSIHLRAHPALLHAVPGKIHRPVGVGSVFRPPPPASRPRRLALTFWLCYIAVASTALDGLLRHLARISIFQVVDFLFRFRVIVAYTRYQSTGTIDRDFAISPVFWAYR